MPRRGRRHDDADPLGFERIAWRAQARTLATSDPEEREKLVPVASSNDVPGPAGGFRPAPQ